MQNIPEQFQGSAALQLVQSQNWVWKLGTDPNIELETCPFCTKTGFGKMYVEIHGSVSDRKNRDGLFLCHHASCNKSGNLHTLKQHLGLVKADAPQKDWMSAAGGQKKQDPLPDVDACHEALLADEAAMDYLINGRGFSREIIQRQKLGLKPKHWFRETGDVRALVYPYLVNGNAVWVHYRTLPTMPLSSNVVPKAFSAPAGWDSTLFNGEILLPGISDLVMVEGECNTIAALDHGITNIVGIPGANIKKAIWLDTIDALGLERLYLCYDKDRPGQKAAQELATRIGIERCWKIVLPDFTVTTEDGLVRAGKDLNEWFVSGGGTAEAFEQLKQDATLFDVAGVASATDAVQEFYDELIGKGSVEPPYKSPWPSLNKLVGFDKGDVISILAPEKVGKTVYALNLVEHMVSAYNEDACFLCLEMTRAKMARKWVSHKAQIKDNLPRTPEEAAELLAAFKESIPKVQSYAANRAGTLYFCYPQYKTAEDIYKLIRDVIRRYGVTWIVLDNLQRLADTTPYGNNKGRTQHLSEISKVLSQISKDLNVQIILILQPHRIAEGKLVSVENVDGSSQIAKDCDCLITLHRGKIQQVTKEMLETCGVVSTEGTYDSKMHINVGLSRYSAGGETDLEFDGATSTVKELGSQVVARYQAEASKNVGYENQLKSLTAALNPNSMVVEEITL